MYSNAVSNELVNIWEEIENHEDRIERLENNGALTTAKATGIATAIVMTVGAVTEGAALGTAIAPIVVSGALAAGAGYGAYKVGEAAHKHCTIL